MALSAFEAFVKNDRVDNFENGFVVPPTSRENIRRYAERVRLGSGLDDRQAIPIVDLLELTLPKSFNDFDYAILPTEKMNGISALTIPDNNQIVLRQDIYEDACTGDGYSRFTIAHEIGHLLMHRDLARREPVMSRTRLYENSEWQADAFAGELLMPAQRIATMSIEQIAERYQVSPRAAEVAKSKLNKITGIRNSLPA